MQRYLVVGTPSPDEDLDFKLLKLFLESLESRDDSLEGCSNVGEVGNSTADDQHFALGMLLLRHQRQDCLGVLVTVKFMIIS